MREISQCQNNQIMDSHSSRGGKYKIPARRVCLLPNSHNISSVKPGVISLLGTVECNQMQEKCKKNAAE